MPLTPNFSITQPVGEPSIVNVEDTSTGSDVAIVSRRVYIATAAGLFLVPTGTATEYVAWALAATDIDIDCLDKDYATSITVEWLSVAGAILYSKTAKYGLTAWNEEEDYGLTTLLSSNPLLINDKNFFENKSKLRTYIDSGNQAIELAGDLYSAQNCYDEATNLRINAQYFFNKSS